MNLSLPFLQHRKTTGFILGIVFFAALLLFKPYNGMPPGSIEVAAIAFLMACFWITEAIPIPATALLPVILFPLLGVMPISQTTEFYAHNLIFLFMGGFLIALSIEKWNLHKRIALGTILLIGTSSSQIILGFMIATAFLSAWISNTATAMMMVTIGMSVAKQTQQALPDHTGHSKFSIALMLGIAYSASIGGVATLIGTPPNAILAGVIESTYNIQISFVQWMMFATPLSIFLLFICWFYLTRFAYKPEFNQLPGGTASIQQALDKLGPIAQAEKKVLSIFTLVACGWIFRGLFDIPALDALNDAGIAITGALLLFIIPSQGSASEKLLDWNTAQKLPWDIIILFGGGFALAGGFGHTGLSTWMASQLTNIQGTELIIIVLLVVLLVIFLTEVTSNTATASMLLPVMGAFALAIHQHPLYLMVATALAASFAFMLPVATPPNAIAYSSRFFDIPQMAKAGFWLNIIGSILITLFVIFYLPLIFTEISKN